MSDLLNLRSFVAAATAGSFAAAAKRLGVTPAMVGRRIQALEQRYGARLIERTTRHQRLTELGTAFLAQAETLLEAAAALDDLTAATPGRLEGRIRMTGPATLGIHQLAALVAEFCEQHSGVTVEMSLNDRRADIVAEGFDLAVRIGALPATSLISRRVGTYRFILCAAPAYLAAAGAPRDPDELAGHRCLINLNMVPRNRWPLFDREGGETVAEVNGRLQIDNGEAQRSAALAGAGITYLPAALVAADVAAGALVRVLPEWETTTMPISLLHPSRRLVPRHVRALLDWLAAGLADR